MRSSVRKCLTSLIENLHRIHGQDFYLELSDEGFTNDNCWQLLWIFVMHFFLHFYTFCTLFYKQLRL